MASRLLRRSGVAVGLVAECLGWRADLVVQVGVGHNHEEVTVLKEEWPGVEFVGFEPHPHIFASWQLKYPGQLLPYALGAETKNRVDFFAYRHHADGSGLYFPDNEPEEKRRDLEKFSVRMSTLDQQNLGVLPSLIDKRILLWLDCEGNELNVLRGGEQFIHRVQVVNVELTSKPLGSGWCKPQDVHDWLAERGFWLQWIHTQRISAGQVDGVYVREWLFKPEYCCIPQEVQRFQDHKNVDEVFK